ncbi:nucleotide exchange factor GrpE [Sinimarinibacterium sp. NLF-5-8]|uniref:nucleotide exchange factor GrpE n=1 Tax=Sinimarinibacterium sp. NLF-5-8 TaxID=2698684 RepID=UPI00137BC70D|nr:nucleotide exchange factor GrpE [Sinimarinibacterium sp. NLF-5-8]QHS09427.1 nucleotide exchange factor GrpE [Sinimarinibacterium sp. NLF-5-8]
MNDTPETSAADDNGFSEAQPSIEIDVEILQQRLQEAEAQAQAAKDAQLRSMAELENTRRRLERDAQNSLKFANEKIISELLAVCDSLELGLKAAAGADATARPLIEGVELTQRQLLSVLEKHGVKPIDPLGQPFNPEHHEAMSMVPSADTPANHVAGVMQKGYLLHERLLRPAMVMVAKKPD